MKKELIAKLHKSFEECAHKSDQGNSVEFWLARELQELLGYREPQNPDRHRQAAYRLRRTALVLPVP